MAGLGFSVIVWAGIFNYEESGVLRLSEAETSRTLAAITPAFLPLTLACMDNKDATTQASKTRITVPLCKIEKSELNSKKTFTKNLNGPAPIKTSIVNLANRNQATIFVDQGSLSTDFIPLNTGINPIKIDYEYSSGESISIELVITRKP